MMNPRFKNLFGMAQRIFLLALLGLSLQNFASAQGTEPTLRSGDSIVLKLSGVPSEESALISYTYDISDQGTINLTHLGEVRAAGMRPSALQKSIENAYKSAEIYTNPTILISTSRDGGSGTQVVYVSGEVKTPGAIPMRAGMSVHDAITSASGPTDFAKMKAVKLSRGNNTRELDLRRADNPDASLPVQSGDKIHVSQ
ncbi:hypothetical protein FEM03_01685 [Phragmitibacter flavus]|uniref:Uncharacterized protein n=1 Tax=Phragmitibacter flavus TaxID=2576071 RepID=A0A5R8KKF3_9BACT|nr:SLBB domain-containing protein [Phragmitibacter flavus]TLD72808.1 hypothetical protein FEM03_01685 [Phragmitibacter flavus]